MGYLNYRRKHTVNYSHYRSIRERWNDFKVMMKFFFWGAIFAAVIIMVIVGQHK
jgi:hypothetical protein